MAHIEQEDPSLVFRESREYEVRYDPVQGVRPVAVFKYGSWIRSGYVLVYHWSKTAHRD